MASNAALEESRVLLEILNQGSTRPFFDEVWQQRPEIFRFTSRLEDDMSGSGGDGSWNDVEMQKCPLHEMVKQRWHILRKMLVEGERIEPSPNYERPLIFRNRELQPQDYVEEVYGKSLFAPYLNGCSVVLNHADLLSPWVAALCQDLQNSFPHAYANCYLTPPHSQAVPAHADDRDVFVIQLVGSKDWQVFKTVPVPFPYPHEQVGKEVIPVPQEVLDGPLAFSSTLTPGDVLYMPRGYVHQASCSSSLSFHVTIALATHDWSLAGIISMATESILTRSIELRRSVLPTYNQNNVELLQEKIDAAIDTIKNEVTATNILQSLETRLKQHNLRAFSPRLKLIHEARFPSSDDASALNNSAPIVGAEAAGYLTYKSKVRSATPEERALVVAGPDKPRGLNVREEIADPIMGIITQLKSDPSLTCSVAGLKDLLPCSNPIVCDLALLSLAKRAVELGAFAVVY